MSNADIFGDVVETEVPKGNFDPTKQLYNLPDEGVEWFLAKKEFGKPKEIDECTANLVVRFLSWQIHEETQKIYAGSGVNTVGVLRNQLVVRYHPIPEGLTGDLFSGRTPCQMQFGDSCAWCTEKIKADRRFSRDKQPPNYFRDVVAKFKAKDKTVMLGLVYKTDENGEWATDGTIKVFEFANYMKNGRTFSQILNDRANDADKRIRIDKKSYAGYVNPCAINITYSWPTKSGKVDNSKYATWTPTDATPLPHAEAGGPDVSVTDKEWAVEIAQNDPAMWINREAFASLDPVKAGKYVYDLFTGEASIDEEVDLDTADFGQLLAVVEKNKAKFEGVIDPTEFTYDMCEPLRDIVKGVLNNG